MPIKVLELAGIPVLLAPTRGQVHAGLAFRVGMADEPLAKRGVTHLIEHLALHHAGVADYHYNGATGAEHTYFHLEGSAADVVAFLNGVCASLTNLPMQRLATEKEILRTEAGGRGQGVGEQLALWRYGARGIGLTSYPEWGLDALTPDAVREWSARWFTRDNAVLWIAADDLPDGLDLRLPPGVRQPVPPPPSALPVRPAYFTGSGSMVAWDTVVPRGAAAGVFTQVLERQLMRSLRQESGLSYTVRANYEARADGTAVITAGADALPEKQGAVLGGFLDVLARLRFTEADPAEVAAVTNQRRDALLRAELEAGHLAPAALGLLTGRPVQDVGELVEELDRVTPAAVTAVARTAWQEGLLMTPEDTGAEWAGLTAAPTRSDFVIDGTAHRSLAEPGLRLVVGEHGVSVAGEQPVATVLFEACAGMVTWPDGARRLIGHDGITVHVEPTLYENGFAPVPYLDARVPYADRIPRPARSPEQIPQPGRPVQAGGRAGPIVALVLLYPLAVGCGLFAVLVAIVMADPDDALAGLVMMLIFALAGTAAAIQGIVRNHRLLRARR